MKSGKWVAVLAAAAMGAGALPAAWAGGDPSQLPAAGSAAPERKTRPAASAPRAAGRPAAYAPDAALQATRSTVQQREERAFIRQAAVLARFEMQASELAAQRAQSARVREFAQDLHRQQSLASSELQRLLHARSMALPMMENSQRKSLARLARLNGARFDREYLEAVVLRQQTQKAQSYQRASEVAADPALKEWLDRQLPLARQHAAAAERLGAPAASAARTAGRAAAPAAALAR